MEPNNNAFLEDVLTGLSGKQKTIPSRYFYDQKGSALFEQITQLEEYYPTRTELSIMDEHVADIAEAIGPAVRLVEFGSGSSLKTRMLLKHLDTPAAYVPVDISCDFLAEVADDLRKEFPNILVQEHCADYSRPVELPEPPDGTSRTAVFFPGSTIGNFLYDEALRFLERIANLVRSGGGLVIGIDLVKDRDVLLAAYNDASGVTAEFNLNLLDRINRELDGTFDTTVFRHMAFFNEEFARMESHLVATQDLTFSVAGKTFEMREGESIYTEDSHKYTVERFREMASEWFDLESVWTDDLDWFAILSLRAK